MNRTCSSMLALLVVGPVACMRPSPTPVPTPKPEPARLATVTTLVTAPPQSVGMDPALNATLDSIVRAALADRMAPGAALAVGRYGRLVHMRGYGTLDWPERGAPAGREAVDSTTLYDLASLTKVVATTTIAMMLEEAGQLDINRTVASYLVPDFDAPDKANITVRMLLTHSGGLEAYAPLYLQYRGREQYIQQINARPLAYPPGEKMVYSDWDMVLLQAVIERITGQTLDVLARTRIFEPLGMRDTGFNPDSATRLRAAPTANDSLRGGVLQGVVHDANAWAIGGVSGHAGLFSSARDLARFAQMMVNDGRWGDLQLLKPETVARWTAPQIPGSSRALGWDTPSGESSSGDYFSARSYGHTGFTGTSIWIDPERSVFIVLLTNRVNSLGTTERHTQLRRDVANAVMKAILDAPLKAR